MLRNVVREECDVMSPGMDEPSSYIKSLLAPIPPLLRARATILETRAQEFGFSKVRGMPRARD